MLNYFSKSKHSYKFQVSKVLKVRNQMHQMKIVQQNHHRDTSKNVKKKFTSLKVVFCNIFRLYHFISNPVIESCSKIYNNNIDKENYFIFLYSVSPTIISDFVYFYVFPSFKKLQLPTPTFHNYYMSNSLLN